MADGDAAIETALEGTWQLKVLNLLSTEPALTGELLRVLDEVLTPALTPAEQTPMFNCHRTAGRSASHKIPTDPGRSGDRGAVATDAVGERFEFRVVDGFRQGEPLSSCHGTRFERSFAG